MVISDSYWAKKLTQPPPKESPDAFVAVNVTATNTAKLKVKSKTVTETAKTLGVLELPYSTRLVIHSPDLIAQLPALLDFPEFTRHSISKIFVHRNVTLTSFT